ncbi:MAG: proline--tRNA ligase [Candidatus Micrarchaeia archaeon]
MQFEKEEKFSEWYSKVLFDAGIVDIRYPVKGMPVYMPWGFMAIDRMFRYLEQLLDATGHQKALFPVAIPENVFAKESEHIKGFEGEVLWITHGGTTPLEERLVLRPTSETCMYPMFSLWIRSHSDLPLRLYQTTTVYRHETKATRPLIRGREVYWNEAHTAHATFEDAGAQVEEAVKIYSQFFNALCLPYKIIKRPEHDKFPGAVYSYAFDTIMPDGRSLQIGTAHHLGDNFSRAYNVRYASVDGKNTHVYQTSYGISMRALAAVISIHGDEKGLRLPFEVAPVQIVFVPIYSKGNNKMVDDALLKVYDTLKVKYRCLYDSTNKRPGEKFYYWELKGVPIRIEAGARDILQGVVTIVDRTGVKSQVNISSLPEAIETIINDYNSRLAADARNAYNSRVSYAETLDKLDEIMKAKRGHVISGWCGSLDCVDKLTEHTVDILGFEKGNNNKHRCIVCGNEGKEIIIGKPY